MTRTNGEWISQTAKTHGPQILLIRWCSNNKEMLSLEAKGRPSISHAGDVFKPTRCAASSHVGREILPSSIYRGGKLTGAPYAERASLSMSTVPGCCAPIPMTTGTVYTHWR